MSEWEWTGDPRPGAPGMLERALANAGTCHLDHGPYSLRLGYSDIGGRLELAQQVCWRRYRLTLLGRGGDAPMPFDVGCIESQAFPVMDGGGDEATGRLVTIKAGRLPGLAMFIEAHVRLHNAEEAAN
jgi:hypothetical protein